ncbi:hypothetical protein D3C83_288310 [compost metagenome]
MKGHAAGGGAPKKAMMIRPMPSPPTAIRKESVTRSAPRFSAAFQLAWMTAEAMAAAMASGGMSRAH